MGEALAPQMRVGGSERHRLLADAAVDGDLVVDRRNVVEGPDRQRCEHQVDLGSGGRPDLGRDS